MPAKIGGRKLTKKEHKIWKSVKRKTGSGATATAAVKKWRKK